MDRSEVKAIVDAAIEPLMARLGISHWRITVTYDLCENSDDAHAVGNCTRLIDYNRARIELDPDSLDDEEHVLETLRHELYHVILSPFDLYERAVANAIGRNGPLSAVLARVWTFVTEKAAINCERFYQGMSNDLGAFDGSSSSKRRVPNLDPINVMRVNGKPPIPQPVKRSPKPMAKTKKVPSTKPVKDSHPKKTTTGQKDMPKSVKGKGGKAC